MSNNPFDNRSAILQHIICMDSPQRQELLRDKNLINELLKNYDDLISGKPTKTTRHHPDDETNKFIDWASTKSINHHTFGTTAIKPQLWWGGLTYQTLSSINTTNENVKVIHRTNGRQTGSTLFLVLLGYYLSQLPNINVAINVRNIGNVKIIDDLISQIGKKRIDLYCNGKSIDRSRGIFHDHYNVLLNDNVVLDKDIINQINTGLIVDISTVERPLIDFGSGFNHIVS